MLRRADLIEEYGELWAYGRSDVPRRGPAHDGKTSEPETALNMDPRYKTAAATWTTGTRLRVRAWPWARVFSDLGIADGKLSRSPSWHGRYSGDISRPTRSVVEGDRTREIFGDAGRSGALAAAT
jgi:hypothetical protein